MNIPLKSVIMMIGPSGCGKSTFIETKLVPQLKAIRPDANIQVISSDAYRREMLGHDLDRHDERMRYASDGAFAVMEAKFKAVTTFPVTADFVILDATFMGEKSRQQFIDLANTAQYQLVGVCFDYKDREEYFKYTKPEHAFVINQHIKRFKQETLGEIRKKDFDAFFKVKSKDEALTLEKDPSYDLSDKAKLPDFKRYFMVGDLHGALSEFKALLSSVGFKIEDGKIKGNDDTLIILVGDLVDKGNEVAELIDFLNDNLDRVKITIGNHDEVMIKFINGGFDANYNPEKAKWFDSFAKLNDESRKKFMTLMDSGSIFYTHDHFIVTHAPCKNKYLGKFDSVSLKSMRNNVYPRSRDFATSDEHHAAIKKHFEFINAEAKKYDPLHFFGHISVAQGTMIGNKIFTDAGCVYGNKLSGWMFSTWNRRVSQSWVDSSYTDKHPLPDLSFKRDKGKAFEALDFEDKMDVVRFARNKVNFISGTMSPCDKDLTKRTLEDMTEAFGYFKSKGIDRLMLQKKYMGSRANMYIFPNDIEKSYMTSRNGFIIKHIDLKPVYQKMMDFWKAKGHTWHLECELIIIDGELMPWSAMGKGLIDSHFRTAGIGISSELNMLRSTGFESQLAIMKEKYNASDFKTLRQQKKKEELIKTIGEGQYRLMSAFSDVKWNDLEEQARYASVYNDQIKIYGSEGELDFKPFALLKTVGLDGADNLFFDRSNHFVYTMVSDDETLIVATDDVGLDAAKEWFQQRVNEGTEGVVVKPHDIVYQEGVAPYMKVRNPNYLTIIYGYDYQIEPRFTHMIEKKSISNKLKMSIKEFELGKKMLEIPYASINDQNLEYLNITAQMVVEEKREKTLDPRL